MLVAQETLGWLVAVGFEAINLGLHDTGLARQFRVSRPIPRFCKARQFARRYSVERPTYKHCLGEIYSSSSSSEYLLFALLDRPKPPSRSFYRDDISPYLRELPSLVFQMRIGPPGFYCRWLPARQTLVPLARRAHPVTSHHPNPTSESLPTSTLYFRADANPEDVRASSGLRPALNGPTDLPEQRLSSIPRVPRLASAAHPILLLARHPQYSA